MAAELPMNEIKLSPAIFPLSEDSAVGADRPHNGHVSSPVVFGSACPVCENSCRRPTPENLTRCFACGHVFQADLKVTVAYDASYAHQYDKRPVKEMSDLRWDFIQSCLGLSRGSRVLDVGYGNGAFLKRAEAAGMEIFGIDLHSEDFGIPVVDLGTKLFFDLVCFFDSLEHFPDFAPLLKLRTRSAIVSIPETPDFLLDHPGRWRHFKPGEHLHYFSRSSLDIFMRNWGLPVRLAEGHPEDGIRGKLAINGGIYDNIYSAVYTTPAANSAHRP
jgi:hypothetical protein